MLEVLAGPRLAAHLVTPATLATELGLDVADPQLVPLLEAVSAAFAAPEGLGRPLALQTYRSTQQGNGKSALLLPAYPAVELLALAAGNDVIPLDGYRFGTASTGAGLVRCALLSPRGKVWSRSCEYTIDFRAGWVLPGWLVPWSASLSVPVGTFLVGTVVGVLTLLEATAAGVTGLTQPNWDFAEGATTADGTVTWRARFAQQLPADVRLAAILAARQVLQLPNWVEGLASVRIGPTESTYTDGSASGRDLSLSLPAVARRVLRRYE